MYKIIVVDDEVQAVASIIEAIDWEALKVDEVYRAHSMKQAISIFEKNKDIDIMICDIEMPKGSGIDLLRWVRGNYSGVENIFLTCHADFGFAKEAISLRCMDYLLKPIPFKDLTETIKKAIRKIEIKQVEERNRQYGAYWLENKYRIREQFWQELLSGRIPSIGNEIIRVMKSRNIEMELGDSYIPVLMEVRKLGDNIKTWDKDILLFCFRNIAEEVVLEKYSTAIILMPSDDKLVFLIHSKGDEERVVNELESCCKQYIIGCNHYLRSEIVAYIGEGVTIDNIYSQYGKLLELADNNVSMNQDIIVLAKYKKRNIPYDNPDINLWKTLLSSGKKDILNDEIIKYLDRLVHIGEIDSSILRLFCQDFLQILFFVLAEKGVQANLLFKEDEIKKFYFEATQSVEYAKKWTQAMVNNAVGYFYEIENNLPLIEKVKHYISMNLLKNLSREDIAAHVYLNPDYLSRIFKRETGYSLVDYVYIEKMKMAQEMLVKTDFAVCDIASRVGYTNFSHFSKMFKRYSDMNPNEFRRKKSR